MWILQCLICLFAWVTAIEGQCSISVRDGLPPNEPLILQYPAPAHGDRFRYPEGDGNLKFAAGEKVRLVCSGSDNHFASLPNTQKDIIAECKQNRVFNVSNLDVDFGNLNCTKFASSKQQSAPVGNTACSGAYENFEIGYETGNGFITLIEVCHDPTSIFTKYTKFHMTKYIKKAVPRYSPEFAECPLHSISYNHQYVRSVMIDTFAKILGSRSLADMYVTRGSPKYLARGHFVANLDFVYKTQQAATCYYINQAPQWHSCNSGNWVSLEKIVREYATLTNQDLTVYTGGHEIAELFIGPAKRRFSLYLKYENANTHSIPVPRFYWKIIYSESTQRGIAFVEINNQYLKKKDIPLEYNICTPVQNTTWNIKWGASGRHLCSSYICDVDGLQRIVKSPQLTVVGRLKWPGEN